MVTLEFDPMRPFPCTDVNENPTTLPLASADPKREVPVRRLMNPGTLNSDVPLKVCWSSPFACQLTDTSPGGMTPNVERSDCQRCSC